MSKPLVIELFCGAFGWSRGWLEKGGHAIGFDLEHHPWHGSVPDGAELVIQDVRTLHGQQFREADLILASPPCQFFSYTSMPFSRSKQLAAAVRAGPSMLADKLELFLSCFRIQQEASQAAGRRIPMVVENVLGAAAWVGRAKAHYGSYYLYGDVPALIPKPRSRRMKFGSDASARLWRDRPVSRLNDGESPMLHRGETAIKIGGDWFSDPSSISRKHSSASTARRAASAKIAEIPPALSRWIAECYWP